MLAKQKKLIIQNKQSGFSLVEIMISLALGLMILGGAFSYFLSNLTISKNMLSQSKLQQEIRSTADLMQRDLRRAGYKPLGNTNDVGKIYTGKTDAALSSNNCLIYSYINERGALRVSGFLLHNNKMYMYSKSDTATTSCPADASTSTTWAPVTLGSKNKITAFSPTIDETGSRPLLRLNIKGELANDARAAFEIAEQITLQNSPVALTASTGT